MDADFKARIAALSMLDDEYHVIGGDERGGVIVSLEGDQVDFADDLKYRTLNLVPVRDYDALLRYVTRDVQTVGVYPEHVRDELRTVLALHGVQRITSLGYMREYNVARAFLDARVQTIYGGTTEIMKEIIGRGLGV